MRYELLDYQKYQERINELINNEENIFRVIKQEPLVYTRCDFPVEHYTIGDGPNHLVVMGGTHGNELISVDFVTQLMSSIARGEGEFASFNPEEFTIHFIPLQNPEGFVINTTAIKKVIPDGTSDEEIEKICHDYWWNFKQDDIHTRENPSDRSIKMHQMMFASVTPDDLSDDNYELKESVKKLWDTYHYPPGSMINWTANGSGVDLNANTPDNPKNEAMYAQTDVITYGGARYNNLPNNIPSPIGCPRKDADHFEFEPENLALFNMLSGLHESESFVGLITYHGTGGVVYHRPYKFINNENYERNKKINEEVANCYGEACGYATGGRTYLDEPSITGCGDLMRSYLPVTLLVELSVMGGNPIAPYGDRGTYAKTITSNKEAFAKTLAFISERKEEISKNYITGSR